MSSSDRNTPHNIQRDDAAALPDGEAARRLEVLQRAKERSRANQRPRPMENVPRFSDVREQAQTMRPSPLHNTAPPTLSPSTTAALEAVAAANPPKAAEAAAPEPAAEEAQVALDVEAIAELLRTDARTARIVHTLLNPADTETQHARRMRKAVEARCRPLDIGEFIMNGALTQHIEVIPASAEGGHRGLTISLRTVHDGVEAVIDRLLADEMTRIRSVREGEKTLSVEMTERELIRRQNEYALVIHIRAYNGKEWPSLVKASGDVDVDAITQRLSLVRQFSSPMFSLLILNLGWFLERVQETLDVGVLGNG